MNFVVTNPLFMLPGRPPGSGTFAQTVAAAKEAARHRGQVLTTADFRKLDDSIVCGFELVALGARVATPVLHETA